MGHEPGDALAQHLGLEVEALHADEHLAQRVRAHDVGLPLQGQAPRVVHRLAGDVQPLLGWERGEQVHQRQGVVQVAQRVCEAGVPARRPSCGELLCTALSRSGYGGMLQCSMLLLDSQGAAQVVLQHTE